MPILSRFARYFDEVARQGSLRKASERLHVSASAIDRQILRGEEALDTALFERLPQGLRLTAAGSLLLAVLRSTQNDLERLRSDIGDLEDLRRGKVLLAMVEGATFAFVPSTLADFRRLYPAIAFEVSVAGSDQVVASVLAGDAEFGLAINPKPQPGLRVIQNATFPLGVVCLPDHPLTALPGVGLDDCLGYRLVMPDRSLALRDVVDRALANLGVPVEPVVVCNSIAVMKMLVQSGAGVGLLNAFNVADEVASGRLVFRALADGAATPSVLSLCVAADRQLSFAAAAALSAFGQAFLRFGDPGAIPSPPDRSAGPRR